MNLVGKIFVVLIVFMSLVFMSFAMAVYATHKNWREVVVGPDGYSKQLADLQARNTELNAELTKRIKELEDEKKAKTDALAKLENELTVLKQEYATRKEEQDKLEKAEREAVAAMNATQTNATDYRKSLETLRVEILAAQKERDEHFNRVVKVTEELNQAENDKEQLRKRNVDLAKDVARADELLRKLGYDKNRNYSDVPPIVEGVILATPGANLVEISIGSDAGLLPGHKLEVYRISGGQSTYVGRIEVVKTSPDRAVCKIDPNFRISNIMVDDRVATKIK
jgi:hypothetical protein